MGLKNIIDFQYVTMTNNILLLRLPYLTHTRKIGMLTEVIWVVSVLRSMG